MEFKDLNVYKKALEVSSELESQVLQIIDVDRYLKDQMRRAANSIILNIAEGSSRFSPADRKNYFVIARGSAFECVACLDIMETSKNLNFTELKIKLEEISKMLFKMISNLNIKMEGSKQKVQNKKGENIK